MRSFAILTGLIVLAVPATHLVAASNSSSGGPTPDYLCAQDVNAALERERFLYESVLFGRGKAKDDPPGSTRVDADGVKWIKKSSIQSGNGETYGTGWVSDGYDTIDDQEMDEKTYRDPVPQGNSASSNAGKGIFQTQKASTSELIPPLLQSMRAFKCRLAAVCRSVELSLGTPADWDPSEAQELVDDVEGCEPLPFKLMTSCQFQTSDGQNAANATPLLEAIARNYCEPLVERTIAYQEAQLKFLVHEDGANRSIRQLAGYLDPLLEAVRFPLLTPLRQSSTFLNQFSRVPCFLSYCVEKQDESESEF